MHHVGAQQQPCVVTIWILGLVLVISQQPATYDDAYSIDPHSHISADADYANSMMKVSNSYTLMTFLTLLRFGMYWNTFEPVTQLPN